MNNSEIVGTDALRMIESSDASLIDVRTPVEFATLHASPAINLPLNLLNEKSLKDASQSKKVIFICQSGSRGQKAVELATTFGLAPTNLSGGTAAWSAAGLPVVQGAVSVSLERQVRIVAGALVAIGTLGGIFLTPIMLAVPLFVGCGLFFAGVTDTCAMGMLLAKMPWNTKGALSCSTSQAKS